MLDIPRPDKAVIGARLALTDLAGTVSDVMDELDIRGVIPAAKLQPMLPGARIAEVLARAQALSAGEEERNRDVAAGMSVVEVANKACFKKIGS